MSDESPGSTRLNMPAEDVLPGDALVLPGGSTETIQRVIVTGTAVALTTADCVLHASRTDTLTVEREAP